MRTVELDAISADLPAFLDQVAGGETILIALDHRPLAELHPPSRDPSGPPDEEEMAHRRQLVRETDELRAEITRISGINPDSTPMIREMRGN